VLATGFSWRGPWTQTYGGIKVLRVPMILRGRGGGSRLAANYASFALAAAIVGTVRLRSGFDVIFVFEPSPVSVALPALVFGRLQSTPVVMWIQDVWPDILAGTGAVTSPRLLSVIGMASRAIHRQCNHLLVTSEAFKTRLSLDVPVQDIGYLPQWVEDFYQPTTVPAGAPERLELPDGFIVLFAGNLGSAQAFETVLAAAEKTGGTNIHWVILGDGRQRDWIFEQIRIRGLTPSVHMLGRRPATSMPTFFALADCLLVCLRDSPEFNGTIPAKLQSYMACGRPVVAALEGEGRRIVEQAGCGVAVGSGRPDELAAAVQKLAAMIPEERNELGSRGRRYYEQHFDRQKLVARLRAVLMDVKESCAR
jgi:glycosyltransferase involved in cell wall biosynthesis